MTKIMIDGNPVNITNPEKVLWPELGIRKIDYITVLIEIAPYILPHVSNRLLTTIRYPDGVNGKSFFQKNCPNHAPDWLETTVLNDNKYILLNSRATLAWLANQAALEFHVSFNLYNNDCPSYLVFDLDPYENQPFDDVIEAALIINETLKSLEIKSKVKTSGKAGLQVYIPTAGKYNYQTARKINEFFGKYFSQKYPQLFTIERMVNKRERTLYFDYLQMWQGKTIAATYSPRATKDATVSMPLEWDELKRGIRPKDFNLLNVKNRLEVKGDIFEPLLGKTSVQNLDNIIEFM